MARGTLLNLAAQASAGIRAPLPTLAPEEAPKRIGRKIPVLSRNSAINSAMTAMENAPIATAATFSFAVGASYLSWAVTRPNKYVEEHAELARNIVAKGSHIVTEPLHFALEKGGYAVEAILNQLPPETRAVFEKFMINIDSLDPDRVAAYINSMSLNGVANLEAGVISAGISYAIFRFRSVRFNQLSNTKKALFVAALLSSAGLGVMKMHTSIKDSSTIAAKGVQMKSQLGAMSSDVEGLKVSLDKLQDKRDPKTQKIVPGVLTQIGTDSLNAEINNKERPGYGVLAAGTSYVFKKDWDSTKFKEYMGEKKMDEKTQTTYEQRRQAIITTIDTLMTKHKIEGDLIAVVSGISRELNIDAPLALYKRAVETADEQSQATAVHHFIANFSPGATVTPETMDALQSGTINSFIGLLSKYERVTSVEIPKLEAFARDLKQQTQIDISGFVNKIKAEFKPLPVTVSKLQSMLESAKAQQPGVTQGDRSLWQGFSESTFMVDLNDLVLPSEELRKEFQASVEKSNFPFPDMEKNQFWYYLFVLMLTLAYVSSDLLPAPAQKWSNKRVERKLREKLPDELEKLNELETTITERIATSAQRGLALFERALTGTQGDRLHVAPELVDAIQVRTAIRTNLGKGLPGADEDVERKFRMRTLDTQKHVDIYNTYYERLKELDERLKSDPVSVIKEYMDIVNPGHSAALEALNALDQTDVGSVAYQEAAKKYEREYKVMRIEQLKAQARAIEEYLLVVRTSNEALRKGTALEGAVDLEELIRKTTIRFDTGATTHQNFTVPREVQLEAYALATGMSAENLLSDTLQHIRELGIQTERSLGEDEITSSAFITGESQPNLDIDQARIDELKRNSFEDVTGKPDLTRNQIDGTIEDFKRFDEYMRNINGTLHELESGVIASNDWLSDTTPVFEWKLDPIENRFTIFLELRDEEYGKAAAKLVYPGEVPNFERSSEQLSAEIKNWLEDTKATIPALVAQVEHYDRVKSYNELFEQIAKRLKGSTELDIVSSGVATSLDNETKTLIQDLYLENAILSDQAPLMPFVRQGLEIEETKLRHFTDPMSVLTPHGNTNVIGIFNDIQHLATQGSIPNGIDITYDVATESIEVFKKPERGNKSRGNQEKIHTAKIDEYSRESLVRSLKYASTLV